MKRLVTPKIRQRILAVAAALILSGATLYMLMIAELIHWPQPALVWVHLPFHDWRYRIKTDDSGDIALRMYTGFWNDIRFGPSDISIAAIALGDLLLLTLLPGRNRAKG